MSKLNKTSTVNNKCVIVLDSRLPVGLIANTAAILGVSIGQKHPELVGETVLDQDGILHSGIITIPVPVLQASSAELSDLMAHLEKHDSPGLLAVDFCTTAQSCKTYDEYIEKMQTIPADQLIYMGIALCGPRKIVSKLTGSYPLLK